MVCIKLHCLTLLNILCFIYGVISLTECRKTKIVKSKTKINVNAEFAKAVIANESGG